MRFDENARLDPAQVQDRRRGGGVAGPVAIGGGGIGLLVLLVSMLLGINPMGEGGSVGVPSPYGDLGTLREETAGDGAGGATESCRTGADANRREDCRIVGFVNSIQAYWQDEFDRRGQNYELAKTRFFSDQTNTGCGLASSAAGPFYCPLDRMVYIDLDFFGELQTRFGARGGPFAQAYVIAHEYGHHVENQIGVLDRMRDQSTGPQSAAVRVELMADCLAGVWAAHAVQTGFIERLTPDDIADGLDAAAAVGDDRIQSTMRGRVSPESWTHGSAQQRQRWLTTGYETADLGNCDTSRGRV